MFMASTLQTDDRQVERRLSNSEIDASHRHQKIRCNDFENVPDLIPGQAEEVRLRNGDVLELCSSELLPRRCRSEVGGN
jgi:hypothetical protein